MACKHKFYNDLNPILDFEPETLILGTFNPEFPSTNKAEWFYGRIKNNFWYVLPKVYGDESLRGKSPKEWKQFCKKRKIIITDLIASIDDADRTNEEHRKWLSNYSDSNIRTKFTDHTFTDVVALMGNNRSIKHVYLTRGVGEPFWKKLWYPISIYVKNHVGMTCKTLLTPSGYAYFQQGKYNKENPLHPLRLEDYILMRWQEEWHDIKR